MFETRRICLIISILICYLLRAQGADKFTDGNRPYEFGFKVDGQQHRHEKKDKDGIIMGEFGFITADDVYHVTVYATDKEGRFKILSMKNIHLKATPESSKTSTRQGHSLPLPPTAAAAPPPPAQSTNLPQKQSASPPRKSFTAISLEPPGKSCSACSIPTSTTPAPQPPPYNPTQSRVPSQQNNGYGAQAPGQQNVGYGLQAPGQQNVGYGAQAPAQQNVGYGAQPPAQQNVGYGAQPPAQQNNGYGAQPNYPVQQNTPQHGQSYPQQFGSEQSYPEQQNGFGGQNYPLQYSEPQQNYPSHNQSPQDYPNAQNAGSLSSGSNGYAPQPGHESPNRNPKQYNGPGPQLGTNAAPSYPQGPNQGLAASPKPTLLSAQMQIVDKNTDIHHLNPGEKEGLPHGISKNDMVRLLYTFNYTLSFQGHFEEGYSNGIKKGYYFITGRNGVRTRIDYVADDTGFHPKVSQDVLDLLSDEVPKPETERDAKYGLKGYEFKWLYYPEDSKRR